MWEPSPPPIELVRWAPEPANLWIEASPRWRGPSDKPWIDVRTREIGGAGPTGGRRLRTTDARPGSIYLPPTSAGRNAERRALASWALGAGAVILVHQHAGGGRAHGARTGADEGPIESEAAGDEGSPESVEGCTRLVDLLPVLLTREWDSLAAASSASAVVWPLIARLTDDPGLMGEGLDHLAGLGVTHVHPLVPTLTPKSRRLLSEHAGEAAFDRVFHAGTADPRAFAAECLARGLDYLAPRPVATGDPRRLERGIAAELARIADLWTETGGSEPEAQTFFRAARWFEITQKDVRSLWREGNLGIVPWIDDSIETVVAELCEGAARSTLLGRLAHEWPRRRR